VPDYTVGLDLGQSADPSALIVAERLDVEPAEPGARLGERRDIVHAQRWTLGTPYPRIVEDVCALLAEPALAEAPLIVDSTGVGRGVTDLFRDAHRDGHFSRYPIPVTITAGEQAHGLSVPKQDLVSRIQALLQSGRLLLAAEMPLREQLERELVGFSAKTSASGRTTYEALTERIHDDLVLALALAIWHPGHKESRRFVAASGRIYGSPELAVGDGAEHWTLTSHDLIRSNP
jgi:hypothetical protein